MIDASLITTAVITGGVSIAPVASGAGLPVGIILSRTSLLFFLGTEITQKYFKISTIKQEKHDAIKLLAQSKLDSITNIVSQTMQDGDISSIEFHKVLQEVEKYCKFKTDIRNQSKIKVKQIAKEQRKELPEHGRKEGKEDFLAKNWKYFRHPGCQYQYQYHLHPTACDFMVYKDYKIDLEFIFITSIINFRNQEFICSIVYQHVFIRY